MVCVLLLVEARGASSSPDRALASAAYWASAPLIERALLRLVKRATGRLITLLHTGPISL